MTKIKLKWILIVNTLISTVTGFMPLNQGWEYIFHYKSEITGTKLWITLNQTIETDVIVIRISDLSYSVQLKNLKLFDSIDEPTAPELAEMTNSFHITFKDNKLDGFLTTDDEFSYGLKLKYRLANMLTMDMIQYSVLMKMKEGNFNVRNLAFGTCNATLKVVEKSDEIKIGVKAKYVNCDKRDGEINLAVIFDLADNSTTAVVVTANMNRGKRVKKISVVSDMLTYNMGGLKLKMKAVLENTKSEIRDDMTDVVYCNDPVKYTKEYLANLSLPETGNNLR